MTIYEQAPAFLRIGAGMILSANVMKVLRRLGLEQLVVEIGIKANCYVSRAWDTGETMYKIDFDAESKAGSADPMPHPPRRRDGRREGRGAGSIAFDHPLVALDETRDAIRLVFENGAAADVDIVIGADGVNSKVREYLLGSEPPRYSGWPRIGRSSRPPRCAASGFGLHQVVGPGPAFLVYFMTSRRDEVYVIGVVPRAPFESDAASLPSSRAELFQCFDGFHADLLRVIEVRPT